MRAKAVKEEVLVAETNKGEAKAAPPKDQDQATETLNIRKDQANQVLVIVQEITDFFYFSYTILPLALLFFGFLFSWFFCLL